MVGQLRTPLTIVPGIKPLPISAKTYAEMQKVLDDVRAYVKETKETLARIKNPALRKFALK